MLRIIAVIAMVGGAAIPVSAAEHCDSGISAARRGRSWASKMVWIRASSPEDLVPRSVVFTPASHPTGLNDAYAWWSYVRFAARGGLDRQPYISGGSLAESISE